MNLLAIGAHPDDVEFGCAPVLIKEIKRGNRVELLVLSRGEAGSSGTPEQREQEARNAARVMGASIEFLDFGGDCQMRYSPEKSLTIAAEIRKRQPSIVLAPHTMGNQHPDHVVAGKIVRDACRLARYGGLAPLKEFPTHRISALYFYHITRHLDPPGIIIDVTEVMEEWEAVMNCHESQVKSKNYLDLQKSAARLLGLTAGTEYAVGLYPNDPVRVDCLSDLTLSSRNF